MEWSDKGVVCSHWCASRGSAQGGTKQAEQAEQAMQGSGNLPLPAGPVRALSRRPSRPARPAHAALTASAAIKPSAVVSSDNSNSRAPRGRVPRLAPKGPKSEGGVRAAEMSYTAMPLHTCKSGHDPTGLILAGSPMIRLHISRLAVRMRVLRLWSSGGMLPSPSLALCPYCRP